MQSTPEINKHRPRIEVVYAGGTISSLATSEGYREGGHAVDLVGQLEQHIPDFTDAITLGEASVAYTGLSENIDERYLIQIVDEVAAALARSPHSVIVTHGTDSMEQTARALSRQFTEQLQAQAAKIVLTGANNDISAPGTDAWSNLAFAFESAGSDAEPGVYVAFHGKLIPADLVVKEPFNGIEMNYTSHDEPSYEQAMTRRAQQVQEQVLGLEAHYNKPPQTNGIVDYPVNIVRPDHQELLEYTATHDVRAVLLTLYHSGTANTEAPELSVAALAERLAREQGIVCFAVTENGEPVRLSAYETSVKLQEAGIIPLGNMLHDVALAKLWLIDPSLTREDLVQEMQTNRIGELSEAIPAIR